MPDPRDAQDDALLNALDDYLLNAANSRRMAATMTPETRAVVEQRQATSTATTSALPVKPPSVNDIVAAKKPGAPVRQKYVPPTAQGKKEQADLELQAAMEGASPYPSVAGDVAAEGVKGVLGLAEAGIGLGSVVSGGRVGKVADALGVTPGKWSQALDKHMTPEKQAAQKKFDDSKGLVDGAIAVLSNPSLIRGAIIESIPTMLAGGAVGKAVGAAAKLAPVTGGAIGEGIMGTGSQAESIRNDEKGDGSLTLGQTALAAGTGVGQSVIGRYSGKVAERLGINDVDTLMAAVKKSPKAAQGYMATLWAMVKGGAQEGLLEELPQTVVETMAANEATGKPLTQGLTHASIMGVVTGGAMGIGAQHGGEHDAAAPPPGVAAPPVTPPTLNDIAEGKAQEQKGGEPIPTTTADGGPVATPLAEPPPAQPIAQAPEVQPDQAGQQPNLDDPQPPIAVVGEPTQDTQGQDGSAAVDPTQDGQTHVAPEIQDAADDKLLQQLAERLGQSAAEPLPVVGVDGAPVVADSSAAAPATEVAQPAGDQPVVAQVEPEQQQPAAQPQPQEQVPHTEAVSPKPAPPVAQKPVAEPDVPRDASSTAYQPDEAASPEGGFDRSGDTPRWRQQHQAMVATALTRWVGTSTDMAIHMEDARAGAPLPESGSGKTARAQAEALQWELSNRAIANPVPLYRGSSGDRAGNAVTSWTEDRAVAEKWAKQSGGRVETRAAGAVKGLRLGDYTGDSFGERQWLVSDIVTPAAPKPSAPVTMVTKVTEKSAQLPRDLSGASPRYNIGKGSYQPSFESDVDRAAYILAQKTPSKRDKDYLAFVQKALGVDEAGARAHGEAVRARLKDAAKATPPGTQKKPAVVHVAATEASGEKATPVISRPPTKADATAARTDALRALTALDAEKPRPIKKMFGQNPTPAQVTKHAELTKAWNRKRAAAQKVYKAADAAEALAVKGDDGLAIPRKPAAPVTPKTSAEVDAAITDIIARTRRDAQETELPPQTAATPAGRHAQAMGVSADEADDVLRLAVGGDLPAHWKTDGATDEEIKAHLGKRWDLGTGQSGGPNNKGYHGVARANGNATVINPRLQMNMSPVGVSRKQWMQGPELFAEVRRVLGLPEAGAKKATAPTEDTLDTGEKQTRLPEAGAVRDTSVETPQLEAPFSLGRETSERPTGRQAGMFDSAPTPSVPSAASGATAPGAAGGGPSAPTFTNEKTGLPHRAGGDAAADEGREDGQGASDGARPERRRVTAPVAGEVFTRQPQADNDARLTPEVTRELERIADELREFPFVAKSWDWLPENAAKDGNAAGGDANIVGGAPGAPVYDDILIHAPVNLSTRVKGKPQPAKEAHGSRGAVEAAIRKALETRDIPSNLAEGAVRVAERRAMDDYAGENSAINRISRPQLPPHWGQEVSTDFTDALSDAVDEAVNDDPDSFDPEALEAAAPHDEDADADEDAFAKQQPSNQKRLPITPKANPVNPKPIAPVTTKGQIGLPPHAPVSKPPPGGVHVMRLPELVSLARALMGDPRVVKRFRSAGIRGMFSPKIGEIRIAAELFTKGHEQELAEVLAHEMGHLLDWLPSKSLKRGNIVGRLFSLRSFMKDSFTAPDGTTISNDKIKKELIALSETWRPWDRAVASPSFIAYRDSAKELYADAMSALMNNPAMLEKDAPTFYSQLFAGLDTKPEAKRAYFDLQELLAGTPEELIARRRANTRAMFDGGDTAAMDLERLRQQEARASRKEIWQRLRIQHVDKHTPINDRVAELRKKGIVINPDDNPALALAEHNYLGGRLKAATEMYFEPLSTALKDANIPWHVFGEALFYDRIIAGDRSELANPLGYAPDTAAELRADVVNQLTPAQRTVLDKTVTDFRTAMRTIADQAFAAGLYTPEMYAEMQKNPAYVTYRVIEHLDSHVTSKVHRQLGTTKDITHVADASILKALATLRTIAQQEVKQKNFAMLEKDFPEDIQQAKEIGGPTGRRPIESPDPALKLITYYEQGRLRGKYVDEFIADSLTDASVGANSAIVQGLHAVNGKWFKPVFTTFNLGFQASNLRKDFLRTWSHTPDMTLAKLFKGYIRAIPMARSRAFGGPITSTSTASERQGRADLLEAEYAQILSVTFNDLIHGREVEDTQLKETLTKMGVSGFTPRPWSPKLQPFAPVLDPLVKVLDFIEALGNFIETLPKAAGMYHLANGKPISSLNAEQRNFIRQNIGSPDFLARGTYTPISNEFLLFSNAITQSLRADIKIATNPKTRSGFWWKTVAMNIVPKATMFAAMTGLAALAASGPDDDEEDDKKHATARYWNKVLRGISEYDMTNFLVIPLGLDERGNAIYYRAPQDDFGRLIGGLFWKMLGLARGDKPTMESVRQIFDYTAGQVPTVTPAIGLISDVVDVTAGKNVYDSFRSRFLFTDDELLAGGTQKWKKFVGYEFQQMGGAIVWKFAPGEQRPRQQSVGQKILDLPIISTTFGRDLRISNYGEVEKARDARMGKAVEEAQRRVAERTRVNEALGKVQDAPDADQAATRVQAAKDMTAGGDFKSQKEANAKAKAVDKKLRTGLARSGGDATLDQLLSATSLDQSMAVLRDARSHMTAAEFMEVYLAAGKSGMISKDLEKLVNGSGLFKPKPRPPVGARPAAAAP